MSNMPDALASGTDGGWAAAAAAAAPSLVRTLRVGRARWRREAALGRRDRERAAGGPWRGGVRTAITFVAVATTPCSPSHGSTGRCRTRAPSRRSRVTPPLDESAHLAARATTCSESSPIARTRSWAWSTARSADCLGRSVDREFEDRLLDEADRSPNPARPGRRGRDRTRAPARAMPARSASISVAEHGLHDQDLADDPVHRHLAVHPPVGGRRAAARTADMYRSSAISSSPTHRRTSSSCGQASTSGARLSQ